MRAAIGIAAATMASTNNCSGFGDTEGHPPFVDLG